MVRNTVESMGILALDGTEEITLFVKCTASNPTSTPPSRTDLAIYGRSGHETTTGERGCGVAQEQ